MQVERHPYNDPIQKIFPDCRRLFACEGGVVWLAEKDGHYYVIVDEGTLADFLMPGEDDDLLNNLKGVYQFESELDRRHYLVARGWDRYL